MFLTDASSNNLEQHNTLHNFFTLNIMKASQLWFEHFQTATGGRQSPDRLFVSSYSLR